MNFSQFLLQNPEVSLPKTNTQTEEYIKTKNGKNIKPTETIKKENKDTLDNIIDIKSNNINFNSKRIVERPYQSQEFKRGDFVIIQRLENSYLNAYKGYFGQIKEYMIIDESAYVMLEAINNPKTIKFPIGHLVHRNYN
jgi:hypothetical protein